MHTKGPWKYSDVGMVYGENDSEVAVIEPGRERIPNGLLIAAAPDLLEALKHAEARGRIQLDILNRDGAKLYRWDEEKAFLDGYLKIIAKAEGK
jgi:hypothetical protein